MKIAPLEYIYLENWLRVRIYLPAVTDLHRVHELKLKFRLK